jgi:dihydrofolate reductase
VTVVSDNIDATITAIRAEPGRDIWLFGGGDLFASLLAADLVDNLEVSIMPVLLAGGTPLVSVGAPPSRLTLIGSAISPAGIVRLNYEVQHAGG